jgi:hypothetical protein
MTASARPRQLVTQHVTSPDVAGLQCLLFHRERAEPLVVLPLRLAAEIARRAESAKA